MTAAAPLRLLLATDHYPPFIGGAHRQTELIARQLAARGHEVVVATTAQPNLPRVEVEGGFTVYRLRQLRSVFGTRRPGQRHQPPFPDPLTVVGLRRLINRFRPDVVHSYGWFSYSCAAALLGRPTPLLISARDYGYFCPTRNLLRDGHVCEGPTPRRCAMCATDYYGIAKGLASVVGVAASRPLLAAKIDGVHSVSAYVDSRMEREFLAGRPARRRRVSRLVLPSFLEAPQGHDAAGVAAQLAGLPDVPYILFVGALRRVKGVDILLQAYETLADAPPLVLAGTLERDGRRTFPAGVTLLRDLSHDAVLASWDRALFGVVPSLGPEPLGSVVYEAMSRGRAVIGTIPGGHADMIDNEITGLLVPSGDIAALAAAMRRLVAEPTLRAQMGARARERAALFTAERVIPQFEATYRRLLDEAAADSLRPA